MSVRNWHVGKLALVWGGCAFLFAFIVFLESANPFHSGISGIGWPAWFAYVLFCMVVTWVWFGGREGK